MIRRRPLFPFGPPTRDWRPSTPRSMPRTQWRNWVSTPNQPRCRTTSGGRPATVGAAAMSPGGRPVMGRWRCCPAYSISRPSRRSLWRPATNRPTYRGVRVLAIPEMATPQATALTAPIPGVQAIALLDGRIVTAGSLAQLHHALDVALDGKGSLAQNPAVSSARLRAAGAVIVGKTNNPEFCYRGYTDNAVFGLTRNPWSLDRTPGGSSGGAGASVAYGATPLALGTDGGGSIRIPSAFCGVAGHKPSFGLVPKLPGFRGWPTLSVDGPLGASVRDLALALRVIAGAHPADPLTWPVPLGDDVEVDWSRLRVAVSEDLGWAPVEPRGAGGVPGERSTGSATTAPASSRRTRTPAIPTQLWNDIALPEGFASEGPLLEHDGIDPVTREITESGRSATAADYLDAQERRVAFTETWESFFRSDGPTTAGTTYCWRRRCRCPRSRPTSPVPPRSTAPRSTPSSTTGACSRCPRTSTGQPATAVPTGLSRRRPAGRAAGDRPALGRPAHPRRRRPDRDAAGVRARPRPGRTGRRREGTGPTSRPSHPHATHPRDPDRRPGDGHRAGADRRLRILVVLDRRPDPRVRPGRQPVLDTGAGRGRAGAAADLADRRRWPGLDAAAAAEQCRATSTEFVGAVPDRPRCRTASGRRRRASTPGPRPGRPRSSRSAATGRRASTRWSNKDGQVQLVPHEVASPLQECLAAVTTVAIGVRPTPGSAAALPHVHAVHGLPRRRNGVADRGQRVQAGARPTTVSVRRVQPWNTFVEGDNLDVLPRLAAAYGPFDLPSTSTRRTTPATRSPTDDKVDGRAGGPAPRLGRDDAAAPGGACARC